MLMQDRDEINHLVGDVENEDARSPSGFVLFYTGSEFVAELRPRSPYDGTSLAHPFVNHIKVPVRDWDCFGVRGYPIPERLDIIKLLFDGQLVESRRGAR